ncbi:hypothetical protein PR048_000273 [Dryococelus australis]|uniref:DUF4758 domain-containing protein n=1 Tax=Dryococelus australis TaxID=614101 RepID=A0ABQ9IE68_9NEOP|nr:hypothetical protein PR048_000273 [Dryococelus australis]
MFSFDWANLCAADYQPSGGPVYVNPAAAAEQAAAQRQNEAVELLTQTVYGFLDFTTTIGNTVMVFSPQSAPPEGGQPTTKAAPVIDTRPAQPSAPPQDINPSRTSSRNGDSRSEGKKQANGAVKAGVTSPAALLSSVVEVRGGGQPPQSSSVVNVILVEVKSGPQPVTSKVEVKEGFKTVLSKVEVKGGHNAVSSKVEVVTHAPDPPTILPNPTRQELLFSSVVEVRSSADEPAISGNNIFEPEYDFLSRQPSEVVDETFRVFNLKPSSKFSLRSPPRPTAEVRSKVNVVTSQKADGGKTRAGAHPTGLVTKLGGTIVKDGVTTVHETKVIGTYISGKYAQVLQSTSHVHQGSG